MTATSVSADAIRKAYIDEATKAALLGPGNSFGLPRSTITTFKVSELEEGPVILIPAVAGKMIVPLQAMCGTGEKLATDVSGNLGWLAPDPDDPGEHNEPWLSAPTTLFFGGEDLGSLVLLPNASAQAGARLWPECVRDRPLAIQSATPPAARGAKKGRLQQEEDDEAAAEKRYKSAGGNGAAAQAEELPPDPELSIVVFYTVF